MDSLSICWRGMAGTGKKSLLQNSLRAIAELRGVPYTIQMRGTGAVGATGDVTEAGATDEGADPEEGNVGQFLMETSLVHMGLDVARMSMQDKHILRPIFVNLGHGSQVMAGDQGRGHRILVLYHAHLLSSESVILLQSCLEQNEGDLSIWMTSELPVPQRIRDWFVEVSVAGDDHSFENFTRVVTTQPVNLNHKEITETQRKAAIHALAKCEATGGGYTIPSYRIPILWESLFLQLRTIFTNVETDVTPRPGRTGKARKKPVGITHGAVASV